MMELLQSIGRMLSSDEVSTWMEWDPGCFFVAELTTQHKIIALCCGSRLGIKLGFTGLYMVHENYRRRGIGKKIWHCAMERLEGRNIGIRAIEGLFPNYIERYGFEHVADYEIAFYECLNGPKFKGEIPLIHGLSITTIFEGKLVKVQSGSDPKDRNWTMDGVDDLLDRVVDYDRRLHNRELSFIVRRTFIWKSCKTKIAITNDNAVVGYGCFQQNINNRWSLSPLYADSPEIAEVLLWELLQDIDSSEAPEGILVRFPNKNIRCEDLLKRFGFQDTGKRVFTGYTKECIRQDTDRIYAFRSVAFYGE